MKILYVRINEEPKVIEIENTLGAMQELVDGPIEMICPFSDPDIALICNEEGKSTCVPNRPLKIDGRIIDVIYGDFFLCAAPMYSEDFESLSDLQIELLFNLFRRNKRI